MAEPVFTPRAKPVDTVGVQTRLSALPTPVAPVRPLAPNAPALPAPPTKGNSEALIASLASFSKSLTGFLGAKQEQQNKSDSDEAELRAIRDNVSSWSEAVRNDPSLADKSPYFRQMYEARTARNRVQSTALSMISEYSSSPIAGSTDPAEIQKWLSEKYKPLIDSVTSPAERAAMLDEVERTSKQFMTYHVTNSRNNLVYKNKVAFGQEVAGAYDEAATKGGVAAYKTNDPVSKELKPHEAALLNAISGGESAGKYNIRYDGGAGSTFELNGQHPAIKVMTKEGPSDAAGRYQFLSSTWRRVMGDAPFTPENQDIAALKLARMDYKARTGGDLDADVQNEGFSPRIQKALGPTWIALKGNHAKHEATYRATAARYAAGGGGENSGSYEFASVIHRKEALGKAQGMDQADIDSRSVDEAISASLRYRDAKYLDIPLLKRPDGSAGAGMVPGMRDKLMQARKDLQALIVKEDEEATKRKERDKDRLAEKGMDMFADQLLEKLEKGEPATLSTEQISSFNKLFGVQNTAKMVGAIKTLSDYKGTEDQTAIANLEIEANLGVLTAKDVIRLVSEQTIKNGETARRLLGTIKTNRESTVLNDKTVQDILVEAGNVAGAIDTLGRIRLPAARQKAVDALRMGLVQWEKDNPNRPRHEAITWLNAEKDKVIKIYNPGSDFNTPAGPKGEVTPQPGKPAPASAKPGQPTKAAEAQAIQRVTPSASVDWKTTPVYESVEALNDDYVKGLQDPNSDFSKWRREKGLTSVAQVREFLNTQRALIAARTKK